MSDKNEPLKPINSVAEQLILDFQHRPALGLEDFFVSASNRAAIELIDAWPNWQMSAFYMAGPKGSGKSHLAHVWQISSDAKIVSAADFCSEHVGGIETLSAVVIEDLDKGIKDEKALFHLINHGREKGSHILFTGAAGPGQIDITLPDLRSRIRALTVVSIEAPDEMLLRTMMIKQFEDRQVEVSPHLIEYLLPRMERSFEGVGQLVELLDRAALSSGRKLTRQFAGEILRASDRD